ncbi:YbaK/EbsC family protein [Streptomyces sp. PT12]|uniref:YbaK/EbsC family protein n=1 Tax=Streptomyces sp. PT12 TaxID=1510197 RepID=UPI000DE49FE1|nr:YbaK/EbsC family protein [Streptomyces sp. PT12]RBM11796.1 hypothetical protein DEH69_21150 [Streptomyces sp. PT12]
MPLYELGALSAVPASERPDLLAPPVLQAITTASLLEKTGVVEIDPDMSDTAATQEAFGLPGDVVANCVIVAGRRAGVEKVAACVVLADSRADINSTVKRLLDVRKASFVPTETATSTTGMEYGGITPIGLPDGWPVYVDARVIQQDLVLLGSGIRPSKVVIPGILLSSLTGIQIVDDLGISVA